MEERHRNIEKVSLLKTLGWGLQKGNDKPGQHRSLGNKGKVPRVDSRGREGYI